jgi:hypothetical protein
VWAGYVHATVDATVDQMHITHSTDEVPHLAALRWFRPPSGEVWITKGDDGEDAFCEGQENANCPNSVPEGPRSNKRHSGPFVGVMLGYGCAP